MKAVLAKVLYTMQPQHAGRVASAIQRNLNPKKKQFLLPKVSINDFLGQLNDRSVSYAVLEFPEGSERNLELLVGAEDFARIRDLLTEWPAGIPIEVFMPVM